MKLRWYLTVLSLTCLTACQEYDFSEEEGEDEEWSVPIGTGEGTKVRPFTVSSLLRTAHSSEEECWVIGYVVGATYQTMEMADFSSSTTYTRNILLSNDSLCTDIDACLPVELSSTSLQKKYALPHHPDGFHQCVMLLGTPATYFKKNGLRNIHAGHWLYGFDLRTILPKPEEWQKETITSSPKPQ